MTPREQQIGVVVAEESKVGGIGEICRRRGVVHVDFTELLSAERLSLGPPSAAS